MWCLDNWCVACYFFFQVLLIFPWVNVPKGINSAWIYSNTATVSHVFIEISDLLLIEEIKGFALVTGKLLQGAAPLLDGRLNLRGGCVVLDVHWGLHRRLLGRPARRAEQTAETGGVRAGKWEGKRKKSTQTKRIEGWTQAVAPAAEEGFNI